MMQIDRSFGKDEVILLVGAANACLKRVWYLQGRCQFEMTVSQNLAFRYLYSSGCFRCKYASWPTMVREVAVLKTK